MLYKVCFCCQKLHAYGLALCLTVCEGNTRCQLINVYWNSKNTFTKRSYLFILFFFFFLWAAGMGYSKATLVMIWAVSWTSRENILLERDLVSLLIGNNIVVNLVRILKILQMKDYNVIINHYIKKINHVQNLRTYRSEV